jgi:putative flippase GtrA
VQHHAIISPTRHARAGQNLKFACVGCINVAALSGLALNVAMVWLLTCLGMYFITANLVGITLGFAGNYALSSVWVWGRAQCR